MIIYLHGFNSSGEGSKYNFLKKLFANQEVISPSYEAHNPDAAIEAIDDIVYSKNPSELMFIGTSLGGFYAQFLANKHKAKCVLINPSTDPAVTMIKNIGIHTNYKTGMKYEVTKANVDSFVKYYVDPIHDTLVLLDAADEVLDYKIAYSKYKECAKVIVYQGGDHRFQHLTESAEEINALWNTFVI